MDPIKSSSASSPALGLLTAQKPETAMPKLGTALAQVVDSDSPKTDKVGTAKFQQPTKARELKTATDAAEQFESMLLGQMFSSMWQGVGKNELFGDGREMEYYRDFYNKALADSVASGQGIGIKDVILREMKEKMAKEGK